MGTVNQAPHIAGAFQNAVKPERQRKRRKSPPPFSLRLSPEERERLKREAGDVPLGIYIRHRLFSGSEAPRRKVRRPSTDEQGIARALAALGDSRLASNLNQLAKAANLGALPATSEVEAELRAACADVRAMRNALFDSLGIKPG